MEFKNHYGNTPVGVFMIMFQKVNRTEKTYHECGGIVPWDGDPDLVRGIKPTEHQFIFPCFLTGWNVFSCLLLCGHAVILEPWIRKGLE